MLIARQAFAEMTTVQVTEHVVRSISGTLLENPPVAVAGGRGIAGHPMQLTIHIPDHMVEAVTDKLPAPEMGADAKRRMIRIRASASEK